MVMNKLTKECLICIKKTFKKFLSILIIVLLGVGFYAGIKATSPDMKNTLDNYYEEVNFFDINILSNYGISDDNIGSLEAAGYKVEGNYSFDTIVKNEDDYAVKVLSYNRESKINKLILIDGRLPESSEECVIEEYGLEAGFDIGDKIVIKDESLNNKEMIITGVIQSPLYISLERDTTKLLSGMIDFYVYVYEDNFNNDVYSNVYVDLDIDESVFSDKYEEKIKKEKKELKKLLKTFESEKYNEIVIDSRKKIDAAKKLLSENEEKYSSLLSNPYIPDSEKNKIKSQLEKTREEIDSSEDKINSLDKVSWYVLGIDSNVGFYQYDQDTIRITNIAKVFPLVFFVVAILICLTTMTRMVEEERGQIGTLKSLGYEDRSIMFKYILYALLATIIGSLIGVCIGFAVIPKVIFNMYQAMYFIGELDCSFYVILTLQGMIIAVICTVGATIITCKKTLKEVPAELLLPKAPKAGKRVLLEKINFIWKRLSFSRKVTIRNVFRYKKRFLMTIIGISGCSSLILAGFGLKDCISQMVPNQYEGVFNYEVTIMLKEDVSSEVKNNDYEEMLKIDGVLNGLKIQEEAVEMINPDSNQSVILMVPFGDIDGFIRLRDRVSGKEYSLKDGVIVSEKLASLLEIEKGEKITFEGKNKYKLKIDNITENYLFHYLYIDKSSYLGDSYNTILLKTNKMNSKEEKKLAEELKKLESVSTIEFTSVNKDSFDSTMEGLSYVSLVLIVSAGLLALVVLYNLASVNISERKRELATIKVLGFYDKEVYNYVSRETFLLTFIGIFIGMGCGKILTNFIMKTCELDMLMFDAKIVGTSYIYSILITLIFTLLVNILVYFSLKKIDMIESLKSGE